MAGSRITIMGAIATGWLIGLAPAPAQANQPVQICVGNSGGYVARVTFYDRVHGATSWDNLGARTITLGNNTCLNTHSGRDTRVVMELHTGFNWAQACTRSYEPSMNALIVMRGTTLSPSCSG